MNYNKLQKLRESEKTAKIFAEKIGFTPQGVRNLFTRRTLTVKQLENICTIYQVHPCEFFDDFKLIKPPESIPFIVTEGEENYEQVGACNELRNMVNSKDQEIARLNREIGALLAIQKQYEKKK